MLFPNGRGSYVMRVNFVERGATEVTVDSGAEESVCPWEWGQQFGCKVAEESLKLKNASGNFIPTGGAERLMLYLLFRGRASF
eukprot:8478715-Karenia_brevis.AAC.1